MVPRVSRRQHSESRQRISVINGWHVAIVDFPVYCVDDSKDGAIGTASPFDERVVTSKIRPLLGSGRTLTRGAECYGPTSAVMGGA
jgi:hypothetical protein